MSDSIFKPQSHEELTNELEKAMNILEESIKGLTLLSRIPKSFILFLEIPGALWQISKHCRMINILVKKTRGIIEIRGRPEEKEFFLLIDEFKTFRDNFILLFELVTAYKFFFFMERMIKETLDELDELVEDLVIGADDEIGNLISQIADIV